MNKDNVKAAFATSWLWLLLGCGSGSGDSSMPQPAPPPVAPATTSDHLVSYSPVTQDDVDMTRAELDSREYAVTEVLHLERKTLLNGMGETKHMDVIGFKLNGQTLYTAVILPEDYNVKTYPLSLVLTGLDQSNPRLDAEALYNMYQGLSTRIDDFIIVMPAYRGNILAMEEDYASNGDFCDAYDGATDDALAAISAVDQHYENLSSNSILAYGWSRGGLVSLLASQRSEIISMAISVSGPTDFYRQSVAEHYDYQYDCQFETGKTAEQATLKMLTSSPLHFAEYSSVTRIHHGTQDEVVPVWNAREMHSALQNASKDSELYIYENSGHSMQHDLEQFKINFTNDLNVFLGGWSSD